MAWWDFLFGKKKKKEDLRQQLFLALAEHRTEDFETLCRTHSEKILEELPRWRTMPHEIRQDQAAISRYAEDLLAIARFYEKIGDSRFIQLLTGNVRQNPLITWERDLRRADDLIEQGSVREAITLLEGALERTAAFRGTGAEAYRPKTYGKLGIAYFRIGNLVRALDFTERAQVACEEAGDREGAEIYRSNLTHIHQTTTAKS